MDYGTLAHIKLKKMPRARGSADLVTMFIRVSGVSCDYDGLCPLSMDVYNLCNLSIHKVAGNWGYNSFLNKVPVGVFVSFVFWTVLCLCGLNSCIRKFCEN